MIRIVKIVRLDKDADLSTPTRLQMLQNGDYSDVLVLQGFTTGQSSMSVRIDVAEYKHILPAEVSFTVCEPVMIVPAFLVVPPAAEFRVGLKVLKRVIASHVNVSKDGKITTLASAKGVAYIVASDTRIEDIHRVEVQIQPVERLLLGAMSAHTALASVVTPAMPPLTRETDVSTLVSLSQMLYNQQYTPYARLLTSTPLLSHSGELYLIKGWTYMWTVDMFDAELHRMFIPENLQFIWDCRSDLKQVGSCLMTSLWVSRNKMLHLYHAEMLGEGEVIVHLVHVQGSSAAPPWKPEMPLNQSISFHIVEPLSLKGHLQSTSEISSLPIILPFEHSFPLKPLGGSGFYEWYIGNESLCYVTKNILWSRSSVGVTQITLSDYYNPENKFSFLLVVSAVDHLSLLSDVPQIGLGETLDVALVAFGKLPTDLKHPWKNLLQKHGPLRFANCSSLTSASLCNLPTCFQGGIDLSWQSDTESLQIHEARDELYTCKILHVVATGTGQGRLRAQVGGKFSRDASSPSSYFQDGSLPSFLYSGLVLDVYERTEAIPQFSFAVPLSNYQKTVEPLTLAVGSSVEIHLMKGPPPLRGYHHTKQLSFLNVDHPTSSPSSGPPLMPKDFLSIHENIPSDGIVRIGCLREAFKITLQARIENTPEEGTHGSSIFSEMLLPLRCAIPTRVEVVPLLLSSTSSMFLSSDHLTLACGKSYPFIAFVLDDRSTVIANYSSFHLQWKLPDETKATQLVGSVLKAFDASIFEEEGPLEKSTNDDVSLQSKENPKQDETIILPPYWEEIHSNEKRISKILQLKISPPHRIFPTVEFLPLFYNPTVFYRLMIQYGSGNYQETGLNSLQLIKFELPSRIESTSPPSPLPSIYSHPDFKDVWMALQKRFQLYGPRTPSLLSSSSLEAERPSLRLCDLLFDPIPATSPPAWLSPPSNVTFGEGCPYTATFPAAYREVWLYAPQPVSTSLNVLDEGLLGQEAQILPLSVERVGRLELSLITDSFDILYPLSSSSMEGLSPHTPTPLRVQRSSLYHYRDSSVYTAESPLSKAAMCTHNAQFSTQAAFQIEKGAIYGLQVRAFTPEGHPFHPSSYAAMDIQIRTSTPSVVRISERQGYTPGGTPLSPSIAEEQDDRLWETLLALSPPDACVEFYIQGLSTEAVVTLQAAVINYNTPLEESLRKEESIRGPDTCLSQELRLSVHAPLRLLPSAVILLPGGHSYEFTVEGGPLVGSLTFTQTQKEGNSVLHPPLGHPKKWVEERLIEGAILPSTFITSETMPLQVRSNNCGMTHVILSAFVGGQALSRFEIPIFVSLPHTLRLALSQKSDSPSLRESHGGNRPSAWDSVENNNYRLMKGQSFRLQAMIFDDEKRRFTPPALSLSGGSSTTGMRCHFTWSLSRNILRLSESLYIPSSLKNYSAFSTSLEKSVSLEGEGLQAITAVALHVGTTIVKVEFRCQGYAKIHLIAQQSIVVLEAHSPSFLPLPWNDLVVSSFDLLSPRLSSWISVLKGGTYREILFATQSEYSLLLSDRLKFEILYTEDREPLTSLHPTSLLTPSHSTSALVRITPTDDVLMGPSPSTTVGISVEPIASIEILLQHTILPKGSTQRLQVILRSMQGKRIFPPSDLRLKVVSSHPLRLSVHPGDSPSEYDLVSKEHGCVGIMAYIRRETTFEESHLVGNFGIENTLSDYRRLCVEETLLPDASTLFVPVGSFIHYSLNFKRPSETLPNTLTLSIHFDSLALLHAMTMETTSFPSSSPLSPREWEEIFRLALSTDQTEATSFSPIFSPYIFSCDSLPLPSRQYGSTSPHSLPSKAASLQEALFSHLPEITSQLRFDLYQILLGLIDAPLFPPSKGHSESSHLNPPCIGPANACLPIPSPHSIRVTVSQEGATMPPLLGPTLRMEGDPSLYPSPPETLGRLRFCTLRRHPVGLRLHVTFQEVSLWLNLLQWISAAHSPQKNLLSPDTNLFSSLLLQPLWQALASYSVGTPSGNPIRRSSSAGKASARRGHLLSTVDWSVGMVLMNSVEGDWTVTGSRTHTDTSTTVPFTKSGDSSSSSSWKEAPKVSSSLLSSAPLIFVGDTAIAMAAAPGIAEVHFVSRTPSAVFFPSPVTGFSSSDNYQHPREDRQIVHSQVDIRSEYTLSGMDLCSLASSEWRYAWASLSTWSISKNCVGKDGHLPPSFPGNRVAMPFPSPKRWFPRASTASLEMSSAPAPSALFSVNSALIIAFKLESSLPSLQAPHSGMFGSSPFISLGLWIDCETRFVPLLQKPSEMLSTPICIFHEKTFIDSHEWSTALESYYTHIESIPDVKHISVRLYRAMTSQISLEEASSSALLQSEYGIPWKYQPQFRMIYDSSSMTEAGELIFDWTNQSSLVLKVFPVPTKGESLVKVSCESSLFQIHTKRRERAETISHAAAPVPSSGNTTFSEGSTQEEWERPQRRFTASSLSETLNYDNLFVFLRRWWKRTHALYSWRTDDSRWDVLAQGYDAFRGVGMAHHR
ncbi:hypothetical protein IE077_002299 [Cardiosporidium cionae]|uniref:Uncharacterized protein n=1 Tax=Cardiosporidium cionae TaxID=476202 RepID=A0ABQ7JB63_9APIC|nr:hypothetical protein IE077_002299 [Cardiosporidium cionae]|eukprot:KAF8821231.1 hypothetical protein IE077_002299 [Cardiosporidium cionae]